ncbi:unnamed protein product [Darwinula stevensoni]|uniref:GST C-terminal domain-containing protein n=1 Tax=Darwinula stevensoni TaxID=69355 RepID=A0A7R9FTV7_9CRUS|nr:unnamed protein product [Darwinula stevensoni]CAG0906224.1 unnamed protein product [Darwinula stevensoni]
MQFLYSFLTVEDGKKSVNETVLSKLDEALGILDIYIGKSGGYAAGNRLTIADFALLVSIACIEMVQLLDVSKHEHVREWLSKCKAEMDGYEELIGSKAASLREWTKNALG